MAKLTDLLFNANSTLTDHLMKDDNDSKESLAITHLDLDLNIKTLTYQDFWNSCLSLYDLLEKIFSMLNPKLIPQEILGDDGLKIKKKIFPPLIIYGDCKQYTPIFMIVANILRKPFYFINDLKTLMQAKKSFQSINLITCFVVHKDRLQELIQIIGENHEKLENIFEDYLLLYDLKVDEEDNDVEELDICYMINTSGTSKSMQYSDISITSKTIFVPSQSILSNLIDFKQEYDLKPIDVVLVCSPFSFDPSICDLFLALSSRCHVILMDDSLRICPSSFVKVLFEFKITYLTITPSLWNRICFHLLEKLKVGSKCYLTQVNFGGEICPQLCEVKNIWQLQPSIHFRNLYGLSEMSVWASIFNLDEYQNNIESNVPIKGREILDTQVYLGLENEIVLESSRRKCLIFDGKDHWNFQTRLFTKDIGEEKDGFLYYLRRNGEDEFIKLNGVKCYPRKIEKSILGNFNCERDGNLKFHVESCLVKPGKWENFNVLDVILVICGEENQQQIKQKILEHLKNFQNVIALRLHLVDSSHVILNRNGKLDYKKIYENVDQMVPPSMKRQFSKESIIPILEEIFRNHFDIYETNHCLVEYGLDSIKALQIAIEIDQCFMTQRPGILYEILFRNTFEEIVQGVQQTIGSSSEHWSQNDPVIKKFKSDDRNEFEKNETYFNFDMHKIYTLHTGGEYMKKFKISLQWSNFMEQCVDSSPLIVECQKKTLLIVASHAGLICAFDIQTEVPFPLLWYQRISSRIQSSPVASSDSKQIYIADFSGFFRSYQTLTGRPIWTFRTMDQITCTPISFTNSNLFLVFCGSSDHHVYCWQQYTGNLEWKADLDGSSIKSTPTIWFDETLNEFFVIVATLNGSIASFRWYDGQIQWKKSLSQPIFAPIIVYHNLLIVAVLNSRILAISAKNGSIDWQMDISNQCHMFSSPCLIEDSNSKLMIIIGTYQKKVICARLYEKELVWTFETDSKVAADIIFLHFFNILLVVESNGQLLFLDPLSGKSIGHYNEWYRFPGEVFSTPKLLFSKNEDTNNALIFVGCRDSNVHCLKITEIL